MKSERDFLATNSLERNEPDEDQSEKNNVTQVPTSESVACLQDDLLSAKDPTLVFHQKPMSSSTVKETSTANSKIANPQILSEPSTDVANGLVSFTLGKGANGLDAERNDEGSSGHDESSLFSFRTGMRNFAPTKVS